jgi:hypothetical protein
MTSSSVADTVDVGLSSESRQSRFSRPGAGENPNALRRSRDRKNKVIAGWKDVDSDRPEAEFFRPYKALRTGPNRRALKKPLYMTVP